MHLPHIPQYIIKKRNVHISVLNGVLWDMGQVHCEIRAISLFGEPMPSIYIQSALYIWWCVMWIHDAYWDFSLIELHNEFWSITFYQWYQSQNYELPFKWQVCRVTDRTVWFRLHDQQNPGFMIAARSFKNTWISSCHESVITAIPRAIMKCYGGNSHNDIYISCACRVLLDFSCCLAVSLIYRQVRKQNNW